MITVLKVGRVSVDICYLPYAFKLNPITVNITDFIVAIGFHFDLL